MTDKPFVERWAARKAATREQARAEPPASEDPVEAAAETPAPPPAAPISDEDLAALPSVDTLIEGSDIKAFLRPGVPAALKNAALRKMWLATPAIRDHKDIAVDYAWDWNTPGGVPGDGGPLNPERVAQWVRELAGKAAPDARPSESPAKAEKAETAPAQGRKSRDCTRRQFNEKRRSKAPARRTAGRASGCRALRVPRRKRTGRDARHADATAPRRRAPGVIGTRPIGDAGMPMDTT